MFFMKKNQIYLLCIVVFIVAVVGIVYKYNNKKVEEKNTEYGLVERKGLPDTTAEWKAVQAKANTLLQAIKTTPADTASKIKLAALFIQEARITGNYVYYDKAAMKYVNE